MEAVVENFPAVVPANSEVFRASAVAAQLLESQWPEREAGVEIGRLARAHSLVVITQDANGALQDLLLELRTLPDWTVQLQRGGRCPVNTQQQAVELVLNEEAHFLVLCLEPPDWKATSLVTPLCSPGLCQAVGLSRPGAGILPAVFLLQPELSVDWLPGNPPLLGPSIRTKAGSAIVRHYTHRRDLVEQQSLALVSRLALSTRVAFHEWLAIQCTRAAEQRKESATKLFAAGQLHDAIARYSTGLDLLHPLCECDVEQVKLCRMALALNLTSCHLKLQSWSSAVDCAAFVLEIDPSNVKALYRRASGLIQLGHFSRAVADLQHAIQSLGSTTPQIEHLLEQAGAGSIAVCQGYDDSAVKMQGSQHAFSHLPAELLARILTLCSAHSYLLVAVCSSMRYSSGPIALFEVAQMNATLLSDLLPRASECPHQPVALLADHKRPELTTEPRPCLGYTSKLAFHLAEHDRLTNKSLRLDGFAVHLAQTWKRTGTKRFHQEQFALAITAYDTALGLLGPIGDGSLLRQFHHLGRYAHEGRAQAAVLCGNVASAYLKLNNPIEAVKHIGIAETLWKTRDKAEYVIDRLLPRDTNSSWNMCLAIAFWRSNLVHQSPFLRLAVLKGRALQTLGLFVEGAMHVIQIQKVRGSLPIWFKREAARLRSDARKVAKKHSLRFREAYMQQLNEAEDPKQLEEGTVAMPSPGDPGTRDPTMHVYSDDIWTEDELNNTL